MSTDSLEPASRPAGPIARFLLAGCTAAAINWLARIGLSQALPLPAAVVIAYAIGMVAGFFLYRGFVFDAEKGSMPRQVVLFLIVNAIGAAVVLAATLELAALLPKLLPAIFAGRNEAIAHGVAIAIGAVVNFLGHRWLTFANGETQSL